MKYLTVSSVVSAYNANKECTKSKFWGLLAILSSIDYVVKPGYNYDFDASKVSNFLEKLFCLENDIKHYQNSSLWNVMFSKKWAEKASELMLSATPNIHDVATWYYRRTCLPNDITASGLIKMFLESTHISEADAKKLFSFSLKDIEFSEELYTEMDLRNALGISSSNINAEGGSIVAHPGELSRAPFIQTLYAGQSQMECLIITQFKFSELYVGIPESLKKDVSPKETIQTIYYGCPGAGKSYEVKKNTEGEHGEKTIWYSKEKDENGKYPRVDNPNDEEKKNLPNNIFRTTFHPDYDYATFVGCYKPVNNEGKIDYQFVPQVFTNAYVAAYRHKKDPIYLIIEEINRGNCAQIFGDLFQLLDRNDQGVSDYPIKPDTELAKYLETQKDVPYEELRLPANLHIYATMNTSDQSLFPMDSAFKRRWAMEYMPINYDNDKASGFTFTIDDTEHSWVEFLRKVNEMILNATDSEDKQMGEFFIKSSVSEKEFINKVMFYIWNDVCKDLYSSRRISPLYFMRIAEPKDGEHDYFTFADLYGPRNNNSRLLKGFLAYLDKKYSEKHTDASSSAAQQEDSVTSESN